MVGRRDRGPSMDARTMPHGMSGADWLKVHVGMSEHGAIVVGGEALIDLVPHASGELRAHAGGGPYNTARTLGRLEQPVHYLGCLSDDGVGRRLRTQLQADGVTLGAVAPTNRPTTLALAELD